MKPSGARLGDFASIIVPYWTSERKWRARGLLCLILLLNTLIVATSVMFTVWQGAFFNSLERKDWNAFISLLLWWRYTPSDGFAPSFAMNALILIPATAYAGYLQQALQIDWRKWHTDRCMDRWLTSQVYYRIELTDPSADNPDQRISEDVRIFVDYTLTLGLGILNAVMTLISFVVVLWTLSKSVPMFGQVVPGSLVWIALLYAAVGTVLVHMVGRRLVGLRFFQQKVEADFRFGLMRFRENVEAVAFYRGEAAERADSGARFRDIIRNWHALMSANRNLLFFTSGFGQIALVFPLAVVAPAYFAGRIALGGIFQTSNAFVQVQASLSWIVDNYGKVTEWVATMQRLARFDVALDRARDLTTGPTLETSPDRALSLAGLKLVLPDKRQLVGGFDLILRPGDRLLINGASGSGKSTLLRAIAGLWPFGEGAIECPVANRLFLPQRPYMPLGSLKRAVCYPAGEGEFADEVVAESLREAGLGHLAASLYEVDAWDRRLSGGEQQRIGLSRILLLRPDWIFLDEATASLDPASEEQFYLLLTSRLPDAVLVSIAHRTKAADFHNRTLTLEGGAARASSTRRRAKEPASP